jgi:transcriptional regulator with XRE-family HTH domain
MTKEDGGDGDMCLSRTLRDMVLDADSSSLREVISELGIDPNDVAQRGKMAAARALQLTAPAVKTNIHDERTDWTGLHDALSALVQLLRKRDNLSEEELAARARIEVAEIRRIECDRSYTPAPRTIYQLEQAFNLPRRTLVKLSGLTKTHSKEFAEKAVRFAAHSKAIQKISRHERRLLNEFVKFLSSYTDPSGQE